MEMKQYLTAEVRRLMDSGCTNEEACAQCMNDYRKNPKYCYDDKHILPIVIKASQDYMDEGIAGALAGGLVGGLAGGLVPNADGVSALGSAVVDAGIGKGILAKGAKGLMGAEKLAKVGTATGALGGAALGGALDDSVQYSENSLNELAIRGLAEEMGINIEDVESYNHITDKVNLFAGISGKSPETIVQFLNGLDEETLPKGIKYFGAQVAEANAFVKARRDAIKAGKKEFEVDGKVYKVTGDTSQELEEAINELEKISEYGPRPNADAKVGKALKDIGRKVSKGLDKVVPKDAELLQKGAKAISNNPALAGAGTLGLGALAAYGGYKGLKKLMGKDKKKESMFDEGYLDNILDDMLAEEIESVEEAEVVMAVRALADDIQDHVERLGRMANEDLPAIADQMVNEYGAQQAEQFRVNVEQILDQALESSKSAKEGLSGIVNGMTGQDVNVSNIGDMEPESPVDDNMDDLEDIAVSDNEPALSGPEEEPLGRAPVDV